MRFPTRGRHSGPSEREAAGLAGRGSLLAGCDLIPLAGVLATSLDPLCSSPPRFGKVELIPGASALARLPRAGLGRLFHRAKLWGEGEMWKGLLPTTDTVAPNV